MTFRGNDNIDLARARPSYKTRSAVPSQFVGDFVEHDVERTANWAPEDLRRKAGCMDRVGRETNRASRGAAGRKRGHKRACLRQDG